MDERRAERLQPVLAAQREQRLAALDVRLVAQPGMARLELQLRDIGRIGVNVVFRRGYRPRLVHRRLGHSPREWNQKKT